MRYPDDDAEEGADDDVEEHDEAEIGSEEGCNEECEWIVREVDVVRVDDEETGEVVAAVDDVEEAKLLEDIDDKLAETDKFVSEVDIDDEDGDVSSANTKRDLKV